MTITERAQALRLDLQARLNEAQARIALDMQTVVRLQGALDALAEVLEPPDESEAS